jgi:segregation and condensation protein B
MSEEKKIIEALLFSAGSALSLKELKELTGFENEIILEALQELSSEYSNNSTALEIAKIGEKYAMQVKVEYGDKVAKVAPREIPDKLLKTLALIAYHQPIKQSELLKYIGSKVYENVKALEEHGMINTKPSGRTKVITTSRAFLEYFSIDSRRKEEIKKLLEEKIKQEL